MSALSLVANGIKFIISNIYLLVIYGRYWLYKNHFLGSTQFDLPVICIGNLSMGGTGKTPMIDYMITLLENQYKIGVVSRGYKRNSSGFIRLKTNHQATQVGDEAMLIKLKHPNTEVAVGEQRIYAIPQLIALAPDIQVILMDDGFQHLSVKPQLNIVLTTYKNPYWNDKLLPLGTLREPIKAIYKADIIIVTNCPANISESEMQQLEKAAKINKHQKIFFSSIVYPTIYALFHHHQNFDDKLLLITGIANADNLFEYWNNNYSIFHYEYNDHHAYTINDFKDIAQAETSKNWLITEKDAVKFLPFQQWFAEQQINVWVQPIQIHIHSLYKENFDELIVNYLNYYFNNKNSDVPS